MELRTDNQHQIPTPETPEQRMPVTVYASTLESWDICEDLTQAMNGAKRGDSVGDIYDRVTYGQYTMDVPATQASLAYADHVATAITQHPERTLSEHMDALRPSADDRRHWAPIVEAYGIAAADSYAWQREASGIQTYREVDSNRTVSIDAQGQFYDRAATPIAEEQTTSRQLAVAI